VDVDRILSLFVDADLIDAHIWQQEHSCARAAVSSAKHGRRIELFTQVLDLKNLSSAHQRCLKYTKMLFANDAAFYPERLGALYVVNAPWIFPVIWAIVKGWIDPVSGEQRERERERESGAVQGAESATRLNMQLQVFC
jgi:hypothetical protein